MASATKQLDASEVLAAALEQMDGIIAATKLDFHDGINDNHSIPYLNHYPRPKMPSVSSALQELKAAIEYSSCNDDNDNTALYGELNNDLILFVKEWLQKISCREENVIPVSHVQDQEDLHERTRSLESEKENLLLQVSVLTDQVEAQVDKMKELEVALSDRRNQLESTQEMLQQEIITRTSLENAKLDLVTEVSNLRIRLAGEERQRRDNEDKIKRMESEVALLHARLAEKEAELSSVKLRLSCNGSISPASDYNAEIERLKKTLESVLVTNDEKSSHQEKIEELRTSINRYKKMHEAGKSKKTLDSLSVGESHIYDRPNVHDSLSPPLFNSSKFHHEARIIDKPPPVPRLAVISTPISSENVWRDARMLRYSPSPSPVFSLSSTPPPLTKGIVPAERASSTENVSPPSTEKKTPPTKRHYSTMPRQQGVQVLQHIQQQLQQHQIDRVSPDSSPSLAETVDIQPSSVSVQSLNHPGLDPFIAARKSSGVSFGKGFFKLRVGKRSSSAPELVPQPEVIGHDEGFDTLRSVPSSPTGPVIPSRKHEGKDKKGLKRIFGKLKRTGSQRLESGNGEFKRGGVRATAGPRLGWSREIKVDKSIDAPFSSWDTDAVADWLHRMGLSMYISNCKTWVKNGDHLLKASMHDLEKELGIKNYLHRKKLHLALKALGSDASVQVKAAGLLDHHWVLRWLDDIGLPQYKDTFTDARVDGRILHYLTLEDLFLLKISSELHHVSIRRGIQVLRENNFDCHCLKRRSLPEEGKDYTSADVALWTNHRVMEWLKTVDLSEYAPNLRGSGVHGALMMYEPRFTADLLASLLNIPPSKTLLRRHLTTHFKELVGPDLMQQKRESELKPSFSPLVPSAKVKAVRKGQFTLIRKRGKSEVVFEGYVCPMEPTPVAASHSDSQKLGDLQKRRNSDPNLKNVSEAQLQPLEELGDISKDLGSFANVLQNENLLASMTSTNV